MNRLFIEGHELDLTEDFSDRFTYAIDDLQNLDSKSTSVSKTIILPATERNNRTLGNIFEFNHATLTDDALSNVGQNYNPTRQAAVRYECNGLQLIKGVFRLTEIIYLNNRPDSYECFIVGELGGFVTKLGNLRLEDMDFSSYDHNYEVSAITASWDNADTGTGYYYPLIDYGGVSTGAHGTAKKDYQYRAFRAALHLREYMDKIITGAGYTWESDFFNTNFFKRLIIPNNQKDFSILKNSIFYGSYAGVHNMPSDGNTSIEIPVNSFTGGLFTTSDNKTFTYTGTATNVNLKFILNGVQRGANRIYFRLIINGVEYSRSPVQGLGPGVGFYHVIDETIPFDNNDTFQLQSFGQGVFGFYTLTLNSNSVVTVTAKTPVYSPALLGDRIIINQTLPKNIFQRDMFTTVLKMFNLLVTEDRSKNKHLVIKPWVDFFQTSNYEDWSDKIDRSKPMRIKPMSEINARYYELKYKQDNDFYNEEYRKKYAEGYGDRIFDNALDFAKDTEKVEIIFSSTPLVGYDTEDKITPAIFKKSNGVEDKIEHNIRIMQAKKVTGVSSWDIMNLATVLDSNTDYPYAGHLDDPDAPNADINFGVPREIFFELVTGNLSNNLFNAYYSPYFAEITSKDSRLLKAHVKLTDTDIYLLDFSRFVFIDGGLYRKSKVMDYVPKGNEPTQCELLRVIYTTY